jgi:hypothetical protein
MKEATGWEVATPTELDQLGAIGRLLRYGLMSLMREGDAIHEGAGRSAAYATSVELEDYVENKRQLPIV